MQAIKRSHTMADFEEKCKLARKELREIRQKGAWKRAGTRTIAILKHETKTLEIYRY